MKNRWISFQRAIEIIQDYYNNSENGVKNLLPEIVINKSCIQRFENLLLEILEYDLMDDESTIKDKDKRERFYRLTFISEENTKFLKKIRQVVNKENLDYIADYVFVNSQIEDELNNVLTSSEVINYIKDNPYEFHTIENLEKKFPNFHINDNLDKGFYNDLFTFLHISTLGTGDLKEAVNYVFLCGSLALKESKQKNDSMIYSDIIKKNTDKYFEKNSSLLEKFFVDNFYANYEIDTSKFSFEQAVLVLLKLKILTLTLNIILTKQYEYYSVFSKIPLLNTEESISISDVVRMTTTYNSSKELNNNIRKYQRKLKNDYDFFVKKVSKKIEIEKLKYMKYYFLQLIILSEEIEEDEGNIEYIKIVKETKKIIYKLINEEHLTHTEWDYIISYIIYKDVEYHLKEKTFDFMKIRIIEESKINNEVLNLLVKSLEEGFSMIQ